MLQHVYYAAFDAHAEPVNRIIGEFAGIPTTGRDVRVPFCVNYEVAEDGIKQARIYLLVGVLMQQLGATPA